MGWVVREDATILWHQLVEDRSITGRFSTVDGFYWQRGGGRCVRGLVDLVLISHL